MDVTFLYNSMSELNDYDFHTRFEFCVNNLRSGSSNKIRCIFPIPKYVNTSNFYIYRVVRCWNKLPGDVLAIDPDESEDNSEFKTLIAKHYDNLLTDYFNHHNTCTWSNTCICNRCRLV